MSRKNIRGMGLYCGVGVPFETMEKQLDEAHRAGITGVFTSMQLPEADKAELIRDMPRMTALAHSYGITVDADMGERTASMFGIALDDLAAFKKLGLDVIRLDGGYTPEMAAKLSHNDLGIMIELNAYYHSSEEKIAEFERFGLCRENVRFSHNYYPMSFTGLRRERVRAINRRLHEHGYIVGGFIPSQAHHREACGEGLPTIEAHRTMSVFTTAQEAALLGMDDIYIGDDLPSFDEMKTLASLNGQPVTLRVELLTENKALTDWLTSTEIRQMASDTESALIQSAGEMGTCRYLGDCEDGLVCVRRRGDVEVCKKSYGRFHGQVHIVRWPELPASEKVGLAARVIEEDRTLLDWMDGGQRFRLIPADR